MEFRKRVKISFFSGKTYTSLSRLQVMAGLCQWGAAYRTVKAYVEYNTLSWANTFAFYVRGIEDLKGDPQHIVLLGRWHFI